MEQEEAYALLVLLAMQWTKQLLQHWEEEQQKAQTLILDEEKVAQLFPWLISSLMDETLLEHQLGISAKLIAQLKMLFPN